MKRQRLAPKGTSTRRSQERNVGIEQAGGKVTTVRFTAAGCEALARAKARGLTQDQAVDAGLLAAFPVPE